MSSIGVILAGTASGLVMRQSSGLSSREIITTQLVKFSTWWLIAASINDAVTICETDRQILMNSNLSSRVMVARLAFRNFLLAVHVQVALILVFALIGEWQVLIRSILLGPIYFVISVAMLGPMLVLMHLGARSNTFIRLTPSLTQLLMFLSPVLWGALSPGVLATVLRLNPVYWVITTTTEWVVGGPVQVISVSVVVGLLFVSLIGAEMLTRYVDDSRLKTV